MVEAKDPNNEGQRTIQLSDMPYMPATVVSHTWQHDGAILETLDTRSETNIKIYDDDREAHRVGE